MLQHHFTDSPAYITHKWGCCTASSLYICVMDYNCMFIQIAQIELILKSYVLVSYAQCFSTEHIYILVRVMYRLKFLMTSATSHSTYNWQLCCIKCVKWACYFDISLVLVNKKCCFKSRDPDSCSVVIISHHMKMNHVLDVLRSHSIHYETFSDICMQNCYFRNRNKLNQ